MKLALVKSVVLSKALEDPNEFSALHMYIAGFTGFERDENGNFLTKIVDFCGKPTLDIRLALEDYLFNEYQEADKIWDLAEKTIGKKTIDLKVLKVVTL